MFRRVVVSFFFFKQKTAYEMRISDWSSDVCSSDLCPLAFIGAAAEGSIAILPMSPFMAAAGSAWLVSAATGGSAFLTPAAVKAARPREIVNSACFMVFSFMLKWVRDRAWFSASEAAARRPAAGKTHKRKSGL